MVTWFDWRCKDSPTRAHHFVKADDIDFGIVFRCVYCHRHRWHPTKWNTIDRYSHMIREHGEEEAYYRILSGHPAAMALISKLEDLWYVRKEVKDDKDFVEIVKAVMKDREYEKEVE